MLKATLFFLAGAVLAASQMSHELVNTPLLLGISNPLVPAACIFVAALFAWINDPRREV